jgi:glycosyltransferase involved in cell wall biosynthesis
VRVGTTHGPICFGYVGRLVTEKGLPLLLEAASVLKGEGHLFRLKLIGDGPERRDLEAMTRRLGLEDRVVFTGFLQGEAFQAEVADVACVVMPTLMEETFGQAAAAQMMTGRLVIASDAGGLGEIVGDVGLKFSMGDAASLVERLRQVLVSPDIIAELGQRARQRALSMFTTERMVSEYLELYERLAGGDESVSPGAPASNHISQRAGDGRTPRRSEIAK